MNPLSWFRRGGKRAPEPDATAGRREPTVGRRNFKMARKDRLTKSWSGRSTSADANQAIYGDHETLRQRAREQSINTSLMKRFYRLLRQNVVGPYGIRLQSKALLKDGTPDRIVRRLVEKEWLKFCKKGSFDVSRRYSYVGFLWLWIETLARDGEVLVRLHRNWKKNRWGFALQILEADRLDLNLNTLLTNGNRIRMGVELNEYEEPIAYWLLRSHPGDVYQTAEEKYERVLATDLIHTFDPWRPHQARGFTWTHAAALDIHHLEEFRSATRIKAEQSAKITGFYEQNPEWMDPPEDGKDEEVREEVEAGTAKVLPWGLTYKQHQTASPGSDYAPFVKDTQRGAAGGLGPSYNRLANDLEGVNFSSLRSGELDERDFYKCAQELLVSGLLDAIGQAWFESSILTGALDIPPRDLERCSEMEWQARGWDWVDPLKDAKAASESIANRTKSRSYYIRANGDDPEQIFDELEAEEAYLRKKGLLADPSTKTVNPNDSKPEPVAEDE